MSPPIVQPPQHILHCNRADSVLAAIEAAWRLHRAKDGGGSDDLYLYLATMLHDVGVVVDAVDGLNLLEHCRKHDLPIIDIMQTLDSRERDAGYDGGPLSLGDYTVSGQQVFVFYNSTRFSAFAEVHAIAAARVYAPSL